MSDSGLLLQNSAGWPNVARKERNRQEQHNTIAIPAPQTISAEAFETRPKVIRIGTPAAGGCKNPVTFIARMVAPTTIAASNRLGCIESDAANPAAIANPYPPAIARAVENWLSGDERARQQVAISGEYIAGVEKPEVAP